MTNQMPIIRIAIEKEAVLCYIKTVHFIKKFILGIVQGGGDRSLAKNVKL